jgi:hypothetical protein
MQLKKDQPELINERVFAEDAFAESTISEDAVDELDVYEENGEVYKWLSLLLVLIWAITLVVF